MNLQQLLASLFASLKNGLVITAVPSLLTFIGNTSKLDPLSVAGQFGYISQLDLLRFSLQANLTAAGPAELQQIIATIDNEFETALQAALAKAQAAQAGAAGTATAAAAKA